MKGLEVKKSKLNSQRLMARLFSNIFWAASFLASFLPHLSFPYHSILCFYASLRSF